LDNNKIASIDANTFKSLFKLLRLDLESTQIISFNRDALVGLINLEFVCLEQNPISILFPTSISKVCDGNPKCQVYLTTCSFFTPTPSTPIITLLTRHSAEI